jgi:hypothetical protein
MAANQGHAEAQAALRTMTADEQTAPEQITEAPPSRVTYGDLVRKRKEIIPYFGSDSCHERHIAMQLIWPLLNALDSVDDEDCKRLVAEERELLAVCKPYILLNVKPGASADEIEAAYHTAERNLRSTLRPGVTPEAATQFFQELEAAYDAALRNQENPSLLAAVKHTYEAYMPGKDEE